MVLAILRGVFVVLVTCVAMVYLLTSQYGLGLQLEGFIAIGLVTVGLSTVIIAVDVNTPHKKLSALTGVFLGLIGGLVVAYPLTKVVDFVGFLTMPDDETRRQAFQNLLEGVKLLIGLVLSYLGISLVVQTKDDFRFVLPYVEFAKQIRGTRPILLDTSVIIDGRIVDIVSTHLIQGMLVVPRFVLNELQLVADSPDKLRRVRGRRGLETLQKLQSNAFTPITIDDTESQGATVDQKLVSLAQQMQARVMTNDYNLNKIAQLRGVDVINLNDLAKALRPVVLPGEPMRVKVVKAGEAASQGVGYLDDGTMVVVENARQVIGQEIDLVVTSTLQTSAGRMIFGRYQPAPAGAAGSGAAPAPPAQPPATDDARSASGPSDSHPAEPGPRPPDAPSGSPGPAASPEQRAARPGSSGRNPRRHNG